MAFPLSRLLSFGLQLDKTREAAKKTCIKLLDDADDSIVILSGELNGEFYGDQRVRDALVNAGERGVSMRIAFGPQPSTEVLTVLEELAKRQTNVDLYPLPRRPSRHFMVVDRKTVRVQLEHPPGSEEHRAVVRHNSPELALTYLNCFDSSVKTERADVR